MQISSQLRWNVRRVAIALISIPRRVITPPSIATCIEQAVQKQSLAGYANCVRGSPVDRSEPLKTTIGINERLCSTYVRRDDRCVVIVSGRKRNNERTIQQCPDRKISYRKIWLIVVGGGGGGVDLGRSGRRSDLLAALRDFHAGQKGREERETWSLRVERAKVRMER